MDKNKNNSNKEFDFVIELLDLEKSSSNEELTTSGCSACSTCGSSIGY
ncbi:thiazolylpeptide-type bacteriocin [Hathewaya massiliensis]|nr:thiazolylpeptide-type bacteriocin [Hathewaya massiliensis]